MSYRPEASKFDSITQNGADVVDVSQAQTLTNKTLTSPTVSEIQQFGLLHSDKSGDYTVTDSDGISLILMTTGATDRTVTLPTAADNTGRVLKIKKVDSGAGTCTIDGEGAETVEGQASVELREQYDTLTIICDGVAWFILNFEYSILSQSIVHTGNGEGSTNTSIRRLTTEATSVGAGITYADSATDGASFTINEDGLYAISYSEIFNGTGFFGVSLNSSNLTTPINSIAPTEKAVVETTDNPGSVGTCAVTLNLVSGDIIRPHINTGTTRINSSNNTLMTITQIKRLL